MTDEYFTAKKVKYSHLKGCNLSGTILHQANFSHANLNNVNLTEARGKKANFYRSHISRSNLKGVYFSEANLVGASLNKSDLSYSNFQKANLNHGFLTGSNLIRANFQEAIFSNACLIRTIIDKTHFKDAQYNPQTLFDHNFCPETHGMTQNIQIAIVEIVNSLNYISKISCRYLGASITVKYLEQSRPHCDWISNFEITNKGLIHYKGTLTETINHSQLKSYQQWVNNYIKTCSVMGDYSHRFTSCKRELLNIAIEILLPYATYLGT